MRNKKIFKCPPRIVRKWIKYGEYDTCHLMIVAAKKAEEKHHYVYMCRIKSLDARNNHIYKKPYVVFVRKEGNKIF